MAVHRTSPVQPIFVQKQNRTAPMLQGIQTTKEPFITLYPFNIRHKKGLTRNKRK